jgi:hypothetical protein
VPRPRYSATKRAREINKQQERARKLARKQGRTAQRTSPEDVGNSSAPEAEGQPLARQLPDSVATVTSGAPDVAEGPEARSDDN